MQNVEVKYKGYEDYFELIIGKKTIDVDWNDLLEIRDQITKYGKEIGEL